MTPKCRSCGVLVDYHWIFRLFLYTVVAASIALAGLFLTVRFGIIAGGVLWVASVLAISLIAAAVGPLEAHD